MISACIFPESAVRPFFFDVPAEIPAGTTINETFVEPPDANILLASVRSQVPLGDSDSPFKVVTEERQNSLLSDIINQTTPHEPTAVLLKLVKPITHLPITLKLVAEVSLEFPRACFRDIDPPSWKAT
ncbi:unnamed protein product [Haemonchus placei]|uniref:Uncharacterized protein n=1 Tax=Haemonchus placei TaxID=6290 RepID=A0A3P7T528_HAEPC|nr:unnamed protein product [Haemonchus placei]